MALKNFSKIKLSNNQKSYWKLYDINGDEIEIYTLWTKDIQDKYALQTRDKYAQVVSKFLDYLVEVEIFGKDITRFEIKEAIQNYKNILSKGRDIESKKLNTIAFNLDFNKISPSSWSNNMAAINSFLEFNDELYTDQINHISIKNNIEIPESFASIISNLKSYGFLSSFERNSLK